MECGEPSRKVGHLIFAVAVLTMVGMFCNNVYTNPQGTDSIGIALFSYALIIGFACIVWIAMILVELSNMCHARDQNHTIREEIP